MPKKPIQLEFKTRDQSFLRDLRSENFSGIRIMTRAFTCDSAGWIPVEQVLTVIIEISENIGAGLLSAWLYDRFKKSPPSDVSINNVPVETVNILVVVGSLQPAFEMDSNAKPERIVVIEPFTFTVYTRRWGTTVTYEVTKTPTGWYISHIAINGECGPEGAELFYSNFHQDGIKYPEAFGEFLAWIWRALENNEISHADAQIKLRELADWVSLCERNQPLWSGWNT